MENMDLNENFDVGCVCAQKMSGDYEGPKRREAQIAQPSTPNPMAAAQVAGLRLREQLSEHRWVQPRRPYEQVQAVWGYRIGSRFCTKTYTTRDEAKLALFDDFWAATQDDDRLWVSD
jgi:hypothetical protein